MFIHYIGYRQDVGIMRDLLRFIIHMGLDCVYGACLGLHFYASQHHVNLGPDFFFLKR